MAYKAIAFALTNLNILPLEICVVLLVDWKKVIRNGDIWNFAQ